MNKPVTSAEMQEFKTNPSVTQIGGKTMTGRDKEGNPLFYPNHRERRAIANPSRKRNNRKKTRGRNRF